MRLAPAAERNSGPILDALKRYLHLPSGTSSGGNPNRRIRVMEISSGTGQHCSHFAGASFDGEASRRRVDWLPSEYDKASLDSIEAWIAHTGVGDFVRTPVLCDITDTAGAAASLPEEWSGQVDALVNINMVHIAPWDCCLGLFRHAENVVAPGGIVFMYGPFRVDGTMTESNEQFDESLRQRDPTWGIRDLEAVASAACAADFELEATVAMPANNLSVVFRRRR